MKKGIGDLFQQKTKYFREKPGEASFFWQKKPEKYKYYPSSPQIKLELPQEEPCLSLWKAIENRRSVRNYSGEPLKKAQISRLLWAAQGITRREQGFEFRTAPSAGALYPVETYLFIHNAEEIPKGIYHFAVQEHKLDQLHQGDFRLEIARAAMDQDMAYAAGVVFAWTGVFERSKWKYKQRAYRYVYLDAGHIAQNLALAAVSLRLGTCHIGALYDNEVNKLLGIDGIDESILYMTAVGLPR